MTRPLRVFLCHSSNDKPAVRELYQKLRAEPWIQPWLDEEELYPGQDWNMEIEKAVEATDVIIVCLSKNSVTKEGYFQKEIKTALDYSDYKPEGAVFIIPVRLEECKPPNRLSKWQYADYFEGQRERGLERLLVSLRRRIGSLGSTIEASATIDQAPHPTTLDKPKKLLAMVQSNRQDVSFFNEDFEFIDREIELATLASENLRNSYWQCALLSAPAGYGKSRLLKRLGENIETSPQRLNWIYIDLANKVYYSPVAHYFWEKIFQNRYTDGLKLENARKHISNHILETMSIDSVNGSVRGILLMIDSAENLSPKDEEWLFPLINETVINSYINYDKGLVSFPVRWLLAGRNVEALWSRYRYWEKSSGCRYLLRSERLLRLSQFDQTHVQDLIDRKARKANFPIDQLDIQSIADKLLYLSGGHPTVVNGILDDLIRRGFRQIDSYFAVENSRKIIEHYVSDVVLETLKTYDPLWQNEIRTFSILRMVTLDILETLRKDGLIFWNGDSVTLLRLLRDGQILHFDDKASCYRNDLLRRVIYLDFAFGSAKNIAHIQAVHKCTCHYYKTLIENAEPKSIYFVEWLFHALQMDGLSKQDILLFRLT